MNLLSKLPFFNTDDDAPVEVDEAEARAERIAFHRAKVRNGPVSFKVPTSGQIRRERKRALDGMTRKARRRQIRAHFAAEREGATLRGHLQAAGLLAFSQIPVDPIRQVHSAVWLVRRFGDPDAETRRIPVDEPSVRAALQSGLNRWESIVGLPPSQLSPEYITPFYVEDVAA